MFIPAPTRGFDRDFSRLLWQGKRETGPRRKGVAVWALVGYRVLSGPEWKGGTTQALRS